jgi:uncharacterized protein (TIGR02996 family)
MAKQKAPDRRLVELVDAVYADPLDLAVRQAYGDALLEAGDPRGEFMTLQLGARNPKRERALLAKHGKTWLGAIEPIVETKCRVFRNGFLARTREVPMKNPPRLVRDRDRAKLRALPEWRTVEELEVGNQDISTVDFLASPKPALRGVWKVSLSQIRWLQERYAVLPWTTLGLEGLLFDDFTRTWRTDLEAITEVLPDLCVLDASLVHPVEKLALGKRLDRLRVKCSPTGVPATLVDSLSGLAAEIEFVREYRFDAPDVVRIAGDHVTVEYTNHTPNPAYATGIIWRLAPQSIRSIEIRAPEGAQLDGPNWERLDDALGRRHAIMR